LARFAGLAGSAAATAEIVMRHSVGGGNGGEATGFSKLPFPTSPSWRKRRERERERERERNLPQLVAAWLHSAGFSAPGKPNRLRAGTLRIDINATALLVD